MSNAGTLAQHGLQKPQRDTPGVKARKVTPLALEVDPKSKKKKKKKKKNIKRKKKKRKKKNMLQ